MRIKRKYGACKMADGGLVYGSPTSTPKPGGTTRKRPKVGDKSDDKRLLNPKQRTPSKPPAKADPNNKGSAYRDYRGVQGAVEDAVKGKKMADGGKVKMKPHVPEKRKSPILEAQKKKGYGPGGPQTPGAKAKKKK